MFSKMFFQAFGGGVVRTLLSSVLTTAFTLFFLITGNVRAVNYTATITPDLRLVAATTDPPAGTTSFSPGDSASVNVKVINQSQKQIALKLIGVHSLSQSLLFDKSLLLVAKNNRPLLSVEAPFQQSYVLDTIAPQTQQEYQTSLSLPTTVGNEAQGLAMQLQTQFNFAEIEDQVSPTPTPNPEPPPAPPINNNQNNNSNNSGSTGGAADAAPKQNTNSRQQKSRTERPIANLTVSSMSDQPLIINAVVEDKNELRTATSECCCKQTVWPYWLIVYLLLFIIIILQITNLLAQKKNQPRKRNEGNYN